MFYIIVFCFFLFLCHVRTFIRLGFFVCLLCLTSQVKGEENSTYLLFLSTEQVQNENYVSLVKHKMYFLACTYLSAVCNKKSEMNGFFFVLIIIIFTL